MNNRKKNHFLIILKLIWHTIRDLIIRFMPNFLVKFFIKRGEFAFLVHPRDLSDVSRKYYFAKKFPNWLLGLTTRFLWPIVASRITGLKDKDGKSILGYVVVCPLTADQMMKKRRLAKKRIIQTAKLAEKIGVKIIGLGALGASLTRGGLDLIDEVNIGITTGAAYTVKIVTDNVFSVLDIWKLSVDNVLIGIVGAAGSIGSNSAKILAKNGVKNILLVDVPHKQDKIENLRNELYNINHDISVRDSINMSDIYGCDIIIAATNSPWVTIKNEHIKPGVVIVDDAQPSDVDLDVISKRKDVIVVEGGVASAPDIDCHFNFGLKNKNDIFSCLGEVLILSHIKHKGHFSIGYLDIKNIEKISTIAKKLNFKLADFQNFQRNFSANDIKNIYLKRKNK